MKNIAGSKSGIAQYGRFLFEFLTARYVFVTAVPITIWSQLFFPAFTLAEPQDHNATEQRYVKMAMAGQKLAAAPVISSFTQSGKVGQQVQITGYNFLSSASVKFTDIYGHENSVTMDNTVVYNGTKITGNVPSGAHFGRIWINNE